ncbi:cupin domain-containing protein [Chryseobacterium camelliae]|uniref:Cupin domain-containing protein n=1 Tax=Chryseobacterium camelliae TaxID=1265445 RepID=A0ABY7QLA2_9FLAO|nr:cupin domain-containing protein [Chryseobacterium camelliae]WBV60114.1 cupin domain-containing protein [Chryseobacterium camelliae]
MHHKEFEKSKIYITNQIVEYIPSSVVSKTILEKLTGTINAVSFDDKEGLPESISPFDAFVQIIEGNAEIIIEGASFFIQEGESIIIPADKPHSIKGNERFKMILIIIKSDPQ